MRCYHGLLLAACCWLLLLPSASAATNKVVLANGEWAPYSSEKLPHFGYASHLVSAAFAEVGIDVEYTFYDSAWMRAYENARKGKDEVGSRIDGTLIWLHTPERETAFFYSNPVISGHNLLLHLKEQPLEWQTVNDLNGKLIGAPMHISMPTLEQAQRNGVLNLLRDTESYGLLFSMLFSHSIDAVVLDEQVAKFYLQSNLSQQEQESISYSPTKIEQRQYHLLLTRAHSNNKQLMEKFNQGIQSLQESGKLARMQQALEAGYYYRD